MPRVLREALLPVMLNREHWTIYWSEKMNGAAFILWDIIEYWELEWTSPPDMMSSSLP